MREAKRYARYRRDSLLDGGEVLGTGFSDGGDFPGNLLIRLVPGVPAITRIGPWFVRLRGEAPCLITWLFEPLGAACSELWSLMVSSTEAVSFTLSIMHPQCHVRHTVREHQPAVPYGPQFLLVGGAMLLLPVVSMGGLATVPPARLWQRELPSISECGTGSPKLGKSRSAVV